MRVDIVGNWLSSVALSHSQSKATEEQYKRVWGRFSQYIDMSADEIIAEYDASNDRTFRRKYAGYIRNWMAYLSNPDDDRESISNHSIKVMVGAIASFFKYNDLPLGHIPQAMNGIIYHNRDITKDEILQIMTVSKIRESAFFAVMAQSGLRPHTIRQLRLKNVESFEKIPCMIEVSKEIAKGKFGSYVTFISYDAVKYLKQYLATRSNLSPDSLLFCSTVDENKPTNVKAVSARFRYSAQKLVKTGAMKFEVRKNKPSELRLYNLRKFFRKYANQMGFENVNYLMGHTVRGSDANYKPQDPEFYRELYAEKAMPFLRLEAPTPTEATAIVETLRKQHQAEIEAIKNQYEERLEKIENTIFPKWTTVTDPIAEAKIIGEWIEKHPEEAKQEEEWYNQQIKEVDAWEKVIRENPEKVANYLHDLENKIKFIGSMFQKSNDSKDR